MNIVVVERKTNQQRVKAKRALEIGHDRDGGARSHQDRVLAPLLRQRTPGGGERLHVPVERNGGRGRMVCEFRAAVSGQSRPDIVTKGVPYPLGILPLYQAERNLGGSFRRNHGL